MVNVLRLLSRSVLAYDLTSVAYKPLPLDSNGTPVDGASAGSITALPENPNLDGHVQAAMAAYEHSESTSGATSTKTHTSKHPKHTGGSEHNKAVEAADTGSSCDVEPYGAPQVLDQTFAPFDETTAGVFRYRQQQAVNLGSWFVHENWMTPSLLRCAANTKLSEIDIANGWGSLQNARAVLERHWDTFIDESDFKYLASIGINTVRLPIGYWTLGPDFTSGTPFEAVGEVYRDSWPRVVRAINQAAKYNVGVLVDLHGAVGSQNGEPHSGVSDGKTGLFGDEGNVEKTIKVLAFLAEKLAGVNNVVGIQVLNEPKAGDDFGPLQDFYGRAIDAMRSTTPNAKTLPIYVHDAFDLEKFSPFVASRTDFVVQDHHSYFVFTSSDKQLSASQHMANIRGGISNALVAVSGKQRRNLVVAEWSCALSPESTANEADVDKAQRDFCDAQLKAYANATAGWSFWAYKKEDCDKAWCFKAAVGKSLPSTFFLDGQKGPTQNANNRVSNGSGADTLIMPTISNALNDLKNLRSNILGPQKRTATRLNLAHRFESIHQRQNASPPSSSTPPSTDQMSASMSKGYTDGKNTAKIFRNYNSKLGFSGQFMEDAMKASGQSLVAEGTEDGYRSEFMRGLKEGEKGSG